MRKYITLKYTYYDCRKNKRHVKKWRNVHGIARDITFQWSRMKIENVSDYYLYILFSMRKALMRAIAKIKKVIRPKSHASIIFFVCREHEKIQWKRVWLNRSRKNVNETWCNVLISISLLSRLSLEFVMSNVKLTVGSRCPLSCCSRRRHSPNDPPALDVYLSGRRHPGLPSCHS